MDLNLLKQKMAANAQENTKGEKKDYSTIYWKPTVGKTQIRVLPSVYTPENPFTELKIHYGIGRSVQVSPLNWGEKDPIAEFANVLRSGEYEKEKYVMAKKLDPKTRYFLPIVVRGEEEKGARLWQFGKMVYEELVAIALDEEVGDYTDIVDGRDITVETVGPETTGTDYNKSSVRIRIKTSPLSEKANEVKEWTTNQHKPLDQFKKYSYEEMKTSLAQWLDPEGSNGMPSLTSNKPAPTSNYSSDTSKSKVKENKSDRFDSLFSGESNDADDLPF